MKFPQVGKIFNGTLFYRCWAERQINYPPIIIDDEKPGKI